MTNTIHTIHTIHTVHTIHTIHTIHMNWVFFSRMFLNADRIAPQKCPNRAKKECIASRAL